MNDKLTVSIIGTGDIAGGFDEKKLNSNSKSIFSHAGAYTKNGKFLLKTIYDPNIQRAKEFQKYWNVKNIVNDEDDIIYSYHDIISICSPDIYHFKTIKKILLNNSCKVIFVEKPLGLNIYEIEEIYTLANNSNIKLVVNFQRHFDTSYNSIVGLKNEILAVNCYYIKGLNHIGITMIDTLCMIFGYPKSLFAYNKIFNAQLDEYTYEFILFFNDFNITVKTIDKYEYNYHIFDIDILTKDKRVVFTDNGNSKIEYSLDNYKYSGVKVLSTKVHQQKTQYDISMLKSIKYLYDIANDIIEHNINTINSVYNNHIIVDKIVESFRLNKKIILEESIWKK